jgi:GNAT superfamily N-acetyltransferase
MRKLTNSGQVRRNDEMVTHTVQIRSLQTVADGEIQALSDVLIDCVEGGASVGFIQPLSRAKANAFWLAKMLVHRRARRHGIGTALLAAAERAASSADKTLLVLDTASVDAERLYAKVGWQPCGIIPRFALLPGGGFCDTKFFYRSLKEPGRQAPGVHRMRNSLP